MILLLAEYCINTNQKGNRVAMNYIRQVARAWAKEGIDTIEHAQMHMAALAETAGGAREVLRLLKISRLPTDSEQELYDKWEREWGFSFAAIKAATAATTSARYPSMKYLDGILKNLRQEGTLTAAGVRSYFADHEAEDEQIKALLRAISARAWPLPRRTQGLPAVFGDGLRDGGDAARLQPGGTLGQGQPGGGGQNFAGMAQKGFLHKDEIVRFLEQEQSRQEKIAAMHAAAGVKKRITRADETLYEKFWAMAFPRISSALGLPAPMARPIL